jgi:hypothetical protein
MSGFAIVEFTLESEIDFVPLIWIEGNHCSWPADLGKPLSSSQIKLRDNPRCKPHRKWRRVPVIVRYICGGKIYLSDFVKSYERPHSFILSWFRSEEGQGEA